MKNVKPGWNFPGHLLVQQGLAWFLALIVAAMIALFFASLAQIVFSLTGRKEGGVGKAIVGVILSLVVGSLAAIGTSTFYGWAALLHVK